MRYSLLLWPHANARYEEAMRAPLAAEANCILSSFGIDCNCTYNRLYGVNALCFECEELPGEAMEALRAHSHMFWLCRETEAGPVPVCGAREACVGEDLPLVLKYKGKTNERFTSMLINLALYASDFAKEDRILLCDPMCGKGTTLFLALNRGFDAFGTDIDKKDAAETVDYFKKYLQMHRVKHKFTGESQTVKGSPAVGVSSFDVNGALTLKYAVSDAALLDKVFTKRRADIIVSDLPYGIQHAPGGLKSFEELLRSVLPACRAMLKEGGALAFSFNSLTLPRETVLKEMEKAGLKPLRGGDWENMSHWVEQAVVRDVAVCRR